MKNIEDQESWRWYICYQQTPLVPLEPGGTSATGNYKFPNALTTLFLFVFLKKNTQGFFVFASKVSVCVIRQEKVKCEWYVSHMNNSMPKEANINIIHGGQTNLSEKYVNISSEVFVPRFYILETQFYHPTQIIKLPI